MKRKWKILSTVLCLLFILTACSYKNFEDSLKDKLNKEDTEEYINPAKIPEASTNSEDEKVTDPDEKRLFQIGDTVTYSYPGEESFQYTLHQINLVDNIHDLNLDKEDFISTSFLTENGDVDKEYLLLTVDVTIKNIDYEGLDDDRTDDYSDVPVLYIEDMLGFKSGLEDPQGPFSIESAYFSEHPKENKEKDYYKFRLEKGKELDATVGWFVPANQLEEEPMYYVIGSGGSFDLFDYFELSFE